MANVTYDKVYKRFGEVTAVDNMNLRVADKEFLVLVGPSGCGKTTALRLLAGLEEITEGTISIEDRVVNDVAPKDRDIAMVFQSYALYPHMSVFDNMAFGLKLRKTPKNEIKRRVEEAAQILGIEHLLDRKPRQLSGGQRQRVAVGRAIVREPKVFLFDEPLSNLDAKLRVQTRAEITKLHQRLQTTFIYVTHDQVEAMTMGDRIAVMRDGLVQQCDTPLGLFNSPANRFVAGFIGSPPMNFLDATLHRQDDGLHVDAEHFRVRLPDPAEPEREQRLAGYVGKPVVFGIRPTDIFDSANPGPVEVTAANTIQVQVDVIEPMGAESVLYLSVGDETLVASVDSATAAQEGEALDVVLNMSKAHLFDPGTDQAII
jgi:multiple sugar transport system ATP-binding protein